MRLAGRLSFLALLIAVLDLVLLVQIAGWIGGGPTLLLVLAAAAAGVWLIRRAGSGLGQFLGRPVAAGLPSGPGLVDGAITFTSGVLLIVPGVLTDLLGLLALLPPVRALLRSRVAAWTRGAVASGRIQVVPGPFAAYTGPTAARPTPSVEAPGIEEAEVIEVRNPRDRDAA